MRQSALVGLFVLGLGIAAAAAQDKMVIGGSGAMGEAVTVLAKAYQQKNSSEMINVIPDPMSTTGGIEGTKIGRLTIGLITRNLNDAEKQEGLTYRPASRVPIVVGLHKSLPVSNLSDSQLCDIFSGKTKSWKDVGDSDGKITVVGRKADDNFVTVFRDQIPCFKNLQLSSDAILLVRGHDVLGALNNRPGTIGISGGGAVLVEFPNVKSVAINGIPPAIEAVRTGQYKYFFEVGFVTKGQPTGTAKKFIEFVASADGEKILGKYGMAVAK